MSADDRPAPWIFDPAHCSHARLVEVTTIEDRPMRWCCPSCGLTATGSAEDIRAAEQRGYDRAQARLTIARRVRDDAMDRLAAATAEVTDLRAPLAAYEGLETAARTWSTNRLDHDAIHALITALAALPTPSTEVTDAA